MNKEIILNMNIFKKKERKRRNSNISEVLETHRKYNKIYEKLGKDNNSDHICYSL